MSEIKLFLTDLDGTFLNNEQRICQANLDAARTIRERGAMLTFCSGRPVTMVGVMAKQAQISLPVVGCNGAIIYDIDARRVIYEADFASETLERLARFAFERDLDFCAYTSSTVYYSSNSERVKVFGAYNAVAAECGVAPCALQKIGGANDVIGKKIAKILITELHGGDLQKTAEFLESVGGISFSSSMKNVIDITPCGADKGSGLERIAEYLSLDCENICVVGDNDNDISMMEKAGFAACMANGTDGAKAVADYITERTNAEGGFAEVVSKIYGLQN